MQSILRRTLSSVASKQSHRVPFPKLAVFDLDHTLWNFGVDSFYFTPPFHFDKATGKLIDMSAKPIEYFPDTLKVLQNLQAMNVPVAVASRTRWPTGAYDLLEKLKLKQYINYYEIYPGQKMKHFERLKEQTGIQYSDIIFFDDEERNIVDIGALGVYAVKVASDTGATEAVVQEALSKFSQQAQSRSTTRSTN